MRVKISILIWGLLILAAGFIFLLGNLGYIEVNVISLFLKYWPILLIVVGLSILFDALFIYRTSAGHPDKQAESSNEVQEKKTGEEKTKRPYRGVPFAGIIVTGVGIAFLVSNFTRHEVLVPIILLSVGLAFLIRFLMSARG
ncbi:MAG: DUF5668 domain-containing protein [Actinobacteria bacterium]|nr:DUF5668 domain-containing protein [Actinomycetota bacterium]